MKSQLSELRVFLSGLCVKTVSPTVQPIFNAEFAEADAEIAEKNSEGKVVSNPDIGYGSRDHKYADGTRREFYQIGLSANKTGISVYILGIEDKKYLAETYGKELGKATVTGYCIRFKTLKDININVLAAAIRYVLGG